jgi:general stress protein 26
MQSAKYCALITNGQGRLNARILQPFEPEMDWTIWFGAHPDSRKVAEIRRDPNVTVLYYDGSDVGYATLLGTTQIVDDLQFKQKYWNPNWQSYFPKGPEKDYTLIKFSPDQIELLSFGHKVTPEPFGLRPTILTLKNKQWIAD